MYSCTPRCAHGSLTGSFIPQSGGRALGLQIASAARLPPQASARLDTSPRQLRSPGAWEEEGGAARPHPDAHPHPSTRHTPRLR